MMSAAARLEHESLPDPVMVSDEQVPALGDRKMREKRSAAGDETNGIAACMAIDTEETAPHDGSFIVLSVANHRKPTALQRAA